MLDGALLVESEGTPEVPCSQPLDDAEKDILIRQAGHKIKKLLGMRLMCFFAAFPSIWCVCHVLYQVTNFARRVSTESLDNSITMRPAASHASHQQTQ